VVALLLLVDVLLSGHQGLIDEHKPPEVQGVSLGGVKDPGELLLHPKGAGGQGENHARDWEGGGLIEKRSVNIVSPIEVEPKEGPHVPV